MEIVCWWWLEEHLEIRVTRRCYLHRHPGEERASSEGPDCRARGHRCRTGPISGAARRVRRRCRGAGGFRWPRRARPALLFQARAEGCPGRVGGSRGHGGWSTASSLGDGMGTGTLMPRVRGSRHPRPVERGWFLQATGIPGTPTRVPLAPNRHREGIGRYLSGASSLGTGWPLLSPKEHSGAALPTPRPATSSTSTPGTAGRRAPRTGGAAGADRPGCSRVRVPPARARRSRR